MFVPISCIALSIGAGLCVPVGLAADDVGDVLRVGSRIDGVVDADSAEVTTPTLESYELPDPARGVRYPLEIEAEGPVTIRLQSHVFDAFVVVAGTDGVVVAEDDDGWILTHASAVADLAPGRYTVTACSLEPHGGPFELSVVSGAVAPPQGADRLKEELQQTREAVVAMEKTFGAEAPELVASWNRLGNRLMNVGLYEEATSAMRRALLVSQVAFGESHVRTGIAMSQLGMAFRRNEQFDEAERLYLEGLKIQEASLGPDHLEVGLSLSNLGEIYEATGRYEEAEEPLRRAVAVMEVARGLDHPETALAMNNLAGLYQSQARYTEAEPLFVRVLEILESTRGPNDTWVARTLSNLATNRRHQGRYAAAVPLAVRAVAIQEAALGSDHPEVGVSWNNLALLYRLQGRFAEAESLYLRVLQVWKGALGEDHQRVAMVLNNLAMLWKAQGRLSEADPVLRDVLRITEVTFGPEHPRTASALNNLAQLCRVMSRYDEAAELCERALAIARTALPSGHPQIAECLGGVASLHLRQGRAEEAEPVLLEAIAIREAAFGERHPRTAAICIDLARAYIAQGRVDDAEPVLRRALETCEATLGWEHLETKTALDELALLHWAVGRQAEAMDEMVRSLDVGQSWILRELMSATSDRRFDIAGIQAESIDEAVSLWSAHPGSRPPLDDLYRRVCAWKGVVFRHVARLSRALATATDHDAELGRLRAELTDLEGQLSVLAYAERISDPDAYQQELTQLREQRRETQRAVLARLDIEPERESTDGAELAAFLPDGAVLLDFLIHRPVQLLDGGAPGRAPSWMVEEPRVLCFVTAHGASGPLLLDLGDAVRMREVVYAWLDGVTERRRGAPAGVAREETGAAVRELLLDPILRELPADTTQLFLIADGFLGELPFEAIPIGEKFVIEAVDVVYATDPVTLRDRLASPSPAVSGSPSILAVGGVDYDAGTSEPAGAASERGRLRDWGPLPGTATEVHELARQFEDAHPEASGPELLEGASASESAVKGAAPDHTVLHFATHGFFEREGFVSRWQRALQRAHTTREARGFGALAAQSDHWRGKDPFAGVSPLEGEEPGLLSGLILAGGNLGIEDGGASDDGVLTATEVAGLDLTSCRLAVLSACQSSLGSGRSGEGLQSLRRGFAEAGCDSVIATLWKVDDDATQQLMRAFYEELWVSGRGVSEALRHARLRLLEQHRDPYYWGAFTLSGEWR